ncbi:MAG TPA: UPF0182 family protein [Gemmatimonadales bacterium]|nr:UPF0182 family protein [Gemmatimonadales bacterium]
MSRRGRRVAAILAALVVLLFAGRWTAVVLADRWWAAETSPAAAAFLTDWAILRASLKLLGMAVGAAWFIGHLLAVYRAVGSIQVRRHVANLEIREALPAGSLVAVVVAVGALFGLVVGRGAADHVNQVALAWQGVSFGATEPLLQRDIGLYVAQVPLWRALHDFCFLLVILGLGLVFGLYLVVGAVRWLDGRPAINSHARIHLGWLLVALALTLMWGHLLEPFTLVAGFDGIPDRAMWRATILVAQLLAGVALATAVLSAMWALRARHALAAAGWIVLPLASLVGHWMVPAALGGEGEPVAEQRTLDQFERQAYGLEALGELTGSGGSRAAAPTLPSLWSGPMARRLLSSDSTDVISVDPALLPIAGRPHPVWLATRALPSGHVVVTALADDRTGPGGEGLFYRSQDSVPQPFPTPMLDLGPSAYHGQAPAYRIGGDDAPGVALQSWPRRVLLAWALQAPELLGPVAGDSRVDWALSPQRRLARLAPFASWGEPIARVIDGELVWLVDGYVPAEAFPLSRRIEWNGRVVAGLRPALLATVTAQAGVTRIYLRPGSDALASSWAAVAQGVVEPASAMPEAVWSAAPYPDELFRVQARQIERSVRRLIGSLGGRGVADPADLPRSVSSWAHDTSGLELTVAYERPGERRLGALLIAGHGEERDALRLVRFDSASALPSRGALESRWDRFPSFDALRDSIGEDGGKIERGPVRFDLSPHGVVAYQSHFAGPTAGRVSLAWVTVASGDRQGAGRNLAEAWSNLLGATVPTLAGQTQSTRIEEARRLLLRADSALRAADWSAFGRAWSGLRNALGAPSDSARR